MSLRLFDGFGIELEYMIVDRDTLDVLPIADQILAAKAGEMGEGGRDAIADVEDGPIGWSNELVLHVLELKTNGPAPSLEPLAGQFRTGVEEANRIAGERNACLLPTAMHPWMDPARETRLWPHEYTEVYQAFDRIFGCSGHGWSNLQSTHINLPFGDDEEFGRLHAAIRAVLPLLPALAASSPVVEGRVTGILDNRLEFYRNNARLVPSVTGAVVPEPVFTRSSYESDLLGRIYADLAPHDPEGVLAHEWVNARGAIARFDRGAIEIRVLDVQECPSADLAIAALVVFAVRALTGERWIGQNELRALPTARLARAFTEASRVGRSASLHDDAWLAAFGLGGKQTFRDVWSHLLSVSDLEGELRRTAARLLGRGTLSERITARVGSAPTPEVLRSVYAELAVCLAEDRLLP